MHAEVLRAASAAEARPEAPLHIVGVWQAALLWLEDGRWRKLRSGGAPTEALEVLYLRASPALTGHSSAVQPPAFQRLQASGTESGSLL